MGNHRGDRLAHVAAHDGVSDRPMCLGRRSDDLANFSAVHFGIEQRGELARAEQRRQRFCVHLVEQRIAACPGQRRVEHAIDLPEHFEVGSVPRRQRGDEITVGIGGTARGQLDDRRLDDLTHFEQLRDERLAIITGEVHLGELLGNNRTIAASLQVAGDDQALDRFPN